MEGSKIAWAFDSEFLKSGKAADPSDVHSVQFSNGEGLNVFLEDAHSVKEWLDNHKYLKKMYGFVVLCDLGSLREWLSKENVRIWRRGVQHVGRIRYGSTKITVYDTQPLAKSFGFKNLASVGDYFNIPKLAKPKWLGLRGYQNDREKQEFIEYAVRDAVITAKLARWLIETVKCDPARYASAGTKTKDVFKLPRRLKRVRKGMPIQLSPLESMVKNSCFAGRSECFINGYTPNVVYNDVSSLYPCSIFTTQCLRIKGIKPCKPKDLTINGDLNNPNYGWIEGIFSSQNEYWGLPLRGRNNFYAKGKQIYGIYHSHDIAASKAKILHILRAWKPIFGKRTFYTRKYARILSERVDEHFNPHMKRYAKAILNALYGKLGQSHPIARTSNFYAFSTVLAHSHLIMSKLFDKCTSEIIGMDTDSIFSHSNMSGKWFEVSDGEYSIPITMSVKGKGDIAFFRSKRYILKGKKPVYGRHGWNYFLEDFLKLFNGDIAQLTTRMDIKHTLLTRVKEAKKMAMGRWKTKIVTLDLTKIKQLLTADEKRNRESYDSYQLVMERKNSKSKAWVYEQLLAMQNNPIGYPCI